VAVEACGTFSQTKREVGLPRMLQAGVITTDYASLMVEILKDNSRPSGRASRGRRTCAWTAEGLSTCEIPAFTDPGSGT
jgi:hypothetical protein